MLSVNGSMCTCNLFDGTKVAALRESLKHLALYTS